MDADVLELDSMLPGQACHLVQQPSKVGSSGLDRRHVAKVHRVSSRRNKNLAARQFNLRCAQSGASIPLRIVFAPGAQNAVASAAKDLEEAKASVEKETLG